MGRDVIAERILENSHSQTQGNNIYNMKFILIGSNWSRTYDLKVSNFLFSQNKWAIRRVRLLVLWPISAVYVIGSYEKHILNKTTTNVSYIKHTGIIQYEGFIPWLGSCIKRAWTLWRGHFMVLRLLIYVSQNKKKKK